MLYASSGNGCLEQHLIALETGKVQSANVAKCGVASMLCLLRAILSLQGCQKLDKIILLPIVLFLCYCLALDGS